MSDLMVAALMQFFIVITFAILIRSINKGESGNMAKVAIVVFSIMFTGIFAGLSFPVLVELAPFVRDAAVEVYTATVNGVMGLVK